MARKTFRELVDDLKASRRPLRGSLKLQPALDRFGVDVAGRVCLDVGASTGGFTALLLERGANRVYAVDAGHGQLLGSLRQDPRVVNLEATNIAELSTEKVQEPVEVVTIDVSYLSLTQAVVQLNRLELAEGAELVGLVKPMFELALASAPSDEPTLAEALRRAERGIELAGWRVLGSMRSPLSGAKGAREWFVHAEHPRGHRVQ